jgi:hypothetical protein
MIENIVDFAGYETLGNRKVDKNENQGYNSDKGEDYIEKNI